MGATREQKGFTRESFFEVAGSHLRLGERVTMCRRIECPRCKKPSFAGCGMHVEQVLGDVPKHERCSCHAKDEGASEPSLLRRMFRF